MPKKKTELITSKQIEQDIVNSLNYHKKMTKAEYQKLTIPCIIIAALLFVSVYLLPQLGIETPMKIALYVILAVFGACMITAVGQILLRRHRQKNVHMEDYEVTTEIVSHTEEESYNETSGWCRETVTNYTLYFESGKSWRIPEMNYKWSAELQMSNFSVYNSTNRGDTFIVVTEKRSGNIAMAYPTKSFQYISK